jgi:hypothetical protein
MDNQNGNQFPVWIIDAQSRVCSVTSTGQVTPRSDPDFAVDIGISEDGILWVVSEVPDPDGGGSKIYWSTGDGKWNEINTPDPGAAKITGAGAGQAIYLTQAGDIWAMNTKGAGHPQKIATKVVDIAFGQSYLWAVFPPTSGAHAVLQYGTFARMPFQWNLFPGSPAPLHLTANASDFCYGLKNFKPVYYLLNGTTGQWAEGAKRGLQITFKQSAEHSPKRKNLAYLVTTSANKDGNQIMKWQDGAPGKWIDAGFRAIKAQATYYLEP